MEGASLVRAWTPLLLWAACAATCSGMVAHTGRELATKVPESALKALSSKGYAVVPGFLPESCVSALCNDVQMLRDEGRFKVAGVGEEQTNRLDQTVRRCEQCFLFPRPPAEAGDASARGMFYSVLDQISAQLVDYTGEALEPLLAEGLYAYYPNGGYYKRHVDAAPNRPSALRAWSYLLYLNEDWQPEHGGHLRIFTDGGRDSAPADSPPSYVDVAPTSGTLVLFKSDEVPHEVRETSAQRMAIVGWLSRPVPGSEGRRGIIAGLAVAVAAAAAVKTVPQLLGGGSSD